MKKPKKEPKCKKGSHEYNHTIDPRYLRCLKCSAVKRCIIDNTPKLNKT